MYLVHQTKHKDGKWEIAWTWLPYFISLDKALHRHVGEAMTKEFKGTVIESFTGETQTLKRMHDKVIELILSRYPIPGLKEYLGATIHLQPEEELEA